MMVTLMILGLMAIIGIGVLAENGKVGKEEKEEFLDVDEYNKMNDYDEEEIRKEFDSTIGKKRR